MKKLIIGLVAVAVALSILLILQMRDLSGLAKELQRIDSQIEAGN